MRLNPLILSLALVGAMAMPFLYAAPAQAQRTWVSGVGDDANPCSRTAPCKTWAGAISKTGAGSEIDALDPGGFGALTITKSVTIDGGGGQVASVLVSGTNGFIVSAGATDTVILKNLRFQGIGTGLSAIRFINGLKLVVENVEIYNFTNGVDVANGTANNNTAINNTQIMNVSNAGVLVESPAGTASQVQIDEARIYHSKLGLAITTGNKVLLSRSTSSFASSFGAEADPGATLVLNDNVVSFSVTGVGGGGTIQSFNNNKVFLNTTNGNTAPFGNTTNPAGME